MLLYYNTSTKLNKIAKGQIPSAIEKEDDVEISVDKKKIEIGEGTMIMTVEERKELIFFSDKPKFQMGELLRASAEALGHGILGNSYKAMLNSGTTIVVKRLRDLKPFTKEEFAKILNAIADMKHPNLLPLLAYYHSRDEKLMLYSYAANGNLFTRLHGDLHQLIPPFFLVCHCLHQAQTHFLYSMCLSKTRIAHDTCITRIDEHISVKYQIQKVFVEFLTILT